ncbi:MAG TPA: DUF805 domain-containing protein [Steroidobacteraceae bacterium]|nr:DUF805 domain-containing protein [Steroidobacteraceae bacterium]
MSSNPYAAPRAAVGDIEDAQEFQEVRMWSASGRVGRLRYLAYTTGATLLAVLVATAAGLVLGAAVGSALGILIYIVTVVFSILVAIQRSHDMDWSGWTVLLTIIPVVGLIWVFKAGSAGTNSYGAPPPPNTLGVKILGLLLPIVCIIGILAAIAIPAYVEYTRRAAGG